MVEDEKGRLIIRLGDTTDHGGEVITGADTWTVEGRPVARIGDKVRCPKCDNKIYEIVEGNQKMTLFGRPAAFEYHKTSCGASLLSSLRSHDMARQMQTLMQSSLNNPPNVMNGVLTADASGANYLPTKVDISDVRTNRTPIFRPYQEGDEILRVVINNNNVGHAGFVIGEGENALLYDPGGSYSGCFQKSCSKPNGDHYDVGSGQALFGSDVDIDDYVAYQRSDGEKVNIYLFVIDADHADRIKNLVSQYGGRMPFACATTVSSLLIESGGIFSNMGVSRTPWGLESELKDILYPNRGGLIPAAY